MHALPQRSGPVDGMCGLQWADDGKLCQLLVQRVRVEVFVSRCVVYYEIIYTNVNKIYARNANTQNLPPPPLFTEKSQPVQPASHPYAVTVPIAGTAPTGDQPGVASAGSSAFVTGTSPAQLQAAALWSASGALFSHDAGVKGTVQSALMQVRQATPYQRALIQVEVAAKQLALKIVEAEEIAGSLGQDNGVVGEEDGHELEHEQQMHEYDSPPGDDGQDSGS